MRRFLSRMKSSMLFEIVALRESPLAVGADVRLFSGMYAKMTLKAATGAERQRAPLADVRATTSVDGGVLCEPRGRSETLTAMFAEIWLLAGVHSFVCDQSKLPGKTLSASVAKMRLLPVVHHHVKLELPSLDALSADFAVDKLRFEDATPLWRLRGRLPHSGRLRDFDFCSGLFTVDFRNLQKSRFLLAITAFHFYTAILFPSVNILNLRERFSFVICPVIFGIAIGNYLLLKRTFLSLYFQFFLRVLRRVWRDIDFHLKIFVACRRVLQFLFLLWGRTLEMKNLYQVESFAFFIHFFRGSKNDVQLFKFGFPA